MQWCHMTHTGEVIPASVWHGLSSFAAERLFILFLAPSWQPNRSQGCHAVGGTGLWGHSCSPPTVKRTSKPACGDFPDQRKNRRYLHVALFTSLDHHSSFSDLFVSFSSMFHLLEAWLFLLCITVTCVTLESISIKRNRRLSEICSIAYKAEILLSHFNHLWKVDIFIKI